MLKAAAILAVGLALALAGGGLAWWAASWDQQVAELGVVAASPGVWIGAAAGGGGLVLAGLGVALLARRRQ